MENSPYKIIIFLIMMAFSSLCMSDAFADEGETITAINIDLGKYSVTPDEVKKSVIKSLLEYRWNLEKVSQDYYLASYKKSQLDISVKENSIVISSVKNAKEKWLKSIALALDLQLKYYTYIKRNDP